MWNVTEWQKVVFSDEFGLFWGQMITVYGGGGALLRMTDGLLGLSEGGHPKISWRSAIRSRSTSCLPRP
ncbi:hypothetical protein TNCV_2381911 [Trichonephila clavipes]|nr:hypothetical protein TNCV_2381911 [Trichonephila clavipes]